MGIQRNTVYIQLFDHTVLTRNLLLSLPTKRPPSTSTLSHSHFVKLRSPARVFVYSSAARLCQPVAARATSEHSVLYGLVARVPAASIELRCTGLVVC